jgi:hypothetical protein
LINGILRSSLLHFYLESSPSRSGHILQAKVMLRRLLRGARDWLTWPLLCEISAQTRVHYAQLGFLIRAEYAAKNPLNRFGAKHFSQADEDGITLEIIRRIGINNGSFAEFGVGNGLENNTLVLLASGWRGFWIGAQDLDFDIRSPQRDSNFIKNGYRLTIYCLF